MKFDISILGFMGLAIVVAMIGSFVNKATYENYKTEIILRELTQKIKGERSSFSAGRKTIIVIGRSTSMYSFTNKNKPMVKNSFVNLLKEKSNIINLSSIDLDNNELALKILDLAMNNIPEIDYVVLENLLYLRPIEYFQKFYYAKVLFVCLSSELKSIFHHGQLTADEYFFLEKCPSVLNEVIGESMFGSDESFWQKFDEEKYSELASPMKTIASEKIFYNYYLRSWTENKNNFKIIVLPASSKQHEGISEMPIFRLSKNIISYLNVEDETKKIIKKYRLKFHDIFIDDAHSMFWVHQLIADKFMMNYL